MKISATKTAILVATVWQLGGCATADDSDHLSSTAGESYEDFVAHTYREPWAGGHFIVDGDTPIADEKKLYELWESQQQGGLIINKAGTNDDRWNDTQKLNLTYCVSDNFGSNKTQVLAAITAATDQGWEVRANVNFVYVPAQDANCTASNSNVLFNVRQVVNQPYLARAFFPTNARSSREVLVDTTSFTDNGVWPLSHILGHELGHALGFRHEHTRPDAGPGCFEDNNWRPLTPYDSGSIMHYPQCNGSSDDLNWTAQDATGAQSVYGVPGGSGGGSGGGGGGDTPPPTGTTSTETQTGTLARNASKGYGAYSVKPGTTFTVTMSGTGDPDLYVRWNNAPTRSTFNCRPYINGAAEQCSLTVPSTASKAYIAVNGYAAATYELAISWTKP